MAKPTSYRLPSVTAELIEELAEKLGITRTQVVITAVDRMAVLEVERARRYERRQQEETNAER